MKRKCPHRPSCQTLHKSRNYFSHLALSASYCTQGPQFPVNSSCLVKFIPILNFISLFHLSSLKNVTLSQLFSLESTLKTTSNHHLPLQLPAQQVKGQRVPKHWAEQGEHQSGPLPPRPRRDRGRALQHVAAPDPQLQGSAASSVVQETNSQRATSLLSLFLLTVANITDIFIRKHAYLLTFPCTFGLKHSSP